MTDAERHFLQKEKIYDHLGKIINRVVVEKPQDAHGLVEVLSRLIKESSSGEAVDNAPRPAAPEDASPVAEADSALRVKREEYISKVRNLDKPPGEDDGKVSDGCELPDFMADADMLSWAGVGFGEMESYRIMCSLRRLALKETGNVKSLRLWGKLLGTNADYYIAEAGTDARDPIEEPGVEPPGDEGANKFLYFVTTDLCEEWTRLPDVRPWHIMASRQIKKMLSGNLESEVITHPLFPDASLEPPKAGGDDEPPPGPVIGKPGKEKQLLRAIIARISSDTIVTLKGLVKRDGEEDEDPPPPIVPNEEFTYPTTTELASPAAWIHYRPYLLKSIGRTKHYEDEDPGDDDDAAKKKPEKEFLPDEIRGLKDDGLKWVIKQFGDARSFSNPFGAASTVKERSDVVTTLRCLTWPGAISCVKSGLVLPSHRLVNIYVGYGIAADEPEFFFRAPLDICDEQDVPEEPTEPQGDPDEATKEPE